jgi:cell division septum initiation protein DivIVA
MSEHSELLSEVGMEWEREVRGYNRQQVDNYVAWRAGQVRELESRLSQSLGEIEHLRREIAEARASARRPPHEEISERVGQILKLAADEAKAEREHGAADANDLREAARNETDKLRADAKKEVDQLKGEAQDRAERMLTAAQEQADRAVATATAEAEKMVSTAHAAAEQTVSQANEHAESTVNAAMAQAKQQLDDATARATAIHDGAERRLNLLISRHTETVRRLTEIRDVVTSLVSGEASRGSLEDEVNRALGVQQAANGAGASDGRAGGHEQAQAGTHRAPRQAGPADGRSAAAQPSARDDQPEQAAAVHAAPAGRTSAPAPTRSGAATSARDRDRADSLATPGEHRDTARYQAHGGETGKHVTEAALQAAEEIRQARNADRVLDETPAAGSGRAIDG